MSGFRVAIFSLLIAVSLNPPVCAADDPVPETRESKPAEKLHALFADEWQWRLEQFPTFASMLGDPRYNDRWPDESLAALHRRHDQRIEFLARLDGIDEQRLAGQDRISYRLFRRELQNEIDGFRFGDYLLPVNQRGGIQDENSLADALPFETVRDFENWIARLETFPVYMDQTIDLLREGVIRQVVHARVVMQRVPAQIQRQIVDDPAASLFYKPFRSFPPSIATDEQDRLRKAAQQAIAKKVVPSFRKLAEYFEHDYLPACFERVGISQIPGGQDFYAYRARVFTTTNLTPQQIHDIGLREVERIRGEMEAVIQQVGFKGSFNDFLEHLRTSPEFYFQNPNDLLTAYREVCMRINPQLVKLFGKLPRIPYGIEPIPDHLAPDTTTAYYRPPSGDGRRSGTYFVNLFRPEVRPRYEMEVLSVHEAVPGHHLQIGLAQEIEGLPEFRRFGGYTAFIEGWGLYSESLGTELGLYQDPYSKFGQLTYEMWRAVRLVVDTGMHSLGWTRQQAIDFFTANAAKTQHDIENEIDRYIAWPGQALAYKIGEMRIKDLRARAEKELGNHFDLRAFHDTVLENGAVTLDVLEEIINDWIKGQRSKANQQPAPVP